MRAVHQSTSDANRHQSAIEALARETAVEPSRVRELYERELAHLGANAKVVSYLLVLARRNVRAALRQGHVGKSRSGP